jgi:hypothetical protein
VHLLVVVGVDTVAERCGGRRGIVIRVLARSIVRRQRCTSCAVDAAVRVTVGVARCVGVGEIQ